jgi:hypothetical protein
MLCQTYLGQPSADTAVILTGSAGVNWMYGFTPNDGESACGVNAVELLGSVRSAVNSAWVAVA